MAKKNKKSYTFSVIAKILLLLILTTIVCVAVPIGVDAASVSTELGKDTTFLIEEYIEYKEFTITVTVYDRVTGEPIGEIKVELFYEDTDYPITGSNGNYLTDKDGVIRYEITNYSKGDNYHFEINTPGYYIYIGEEFELTGDMNIVIYLDPIEDTQEEEDNSTPLIPLEPSIPLEPNEPEDDSIPLIPLDPSITVPLDPPSDSGPEPLPEESQKPLPDVDDTVENESVKTGDDSKVIEYLSIATIALVFIIVFLLKKRREDDEDIE